MSSEELYQKGNEMRRAGRFAEAMNLYSAALDKDPNSPARTAREMLEAQFAFFCKDIYNP
ncbi:MAG: tetratricopeptide repeat protein [Prevotella sp.]|nr:tetratricopeptide repeat protein [Prevotella sp.]